mgnify:CR=1 FL=1
MRFYEFKIVESKILNEGTRGIIGVVLDNQSGKEMKCSLQAAASLSQSHTTYILRKRTN